MKKIVTLMMGLGVLIGGLIPANVSAHSLYSVGSGNPSYYHSSYGSSYPAIDGYVLMYTLDWGSSAGTYHTYSKTHFYPDSYTDTVSIKFTNKTADGNDTAGEVMFYLERWNESTDSWLTVSHFGTYKNTGGWIERKLYQEYGGKDLEPSSVYRFRFSSPNNSEMTSTSFAVPSGHSLND